MKLRFQISGLRRLLYFIAFSLLGYCGYVLADAWWFQRDASAAFERPLKPAPEVAVPPPVPAAVERNDAVVGRLVIRRLGLSVMVVEGTSAKALRRAAGHIAGTALPGNQGNTGISGHRDTFFAPLQNIRRDDVVSVTTRKGEFRYRVVSMTIVQPDDIDILAATETEVLTLVTCYPFAFIGSAPERFVVRAERVISESAH